MARSLLAFSFLFIFVKDLMAAQVSEDFSTRSRYASGTAVWNQALGVVHPTLHTINYKGGFTPIPVDVGNGQHGSFELATYLSFDHDADTTGNIISLDTSTFPILQVTSFKLDAGWTLRPIGNNPLIIYSLSDVVIEGTIDCSGGNGGNAIGAAPGSGGVALCGGGHGGSGGVVNGAGTNGANVHATVTGGIAGNAATPAMGGGGGGSWNTTSAAGNGPNAAGGFGLAGNSATDPEFTIIAGGAGGGGGGGNATDAGGGGGAGGGVVVIHAVRDFILGQAPASAFGSIDVSGGNGGSSNVNGGPGGGGGGGSVLVFVGNDIEIYNTDGGGASRANIGTGGTNTVPATGASGGVGRSWFSSEQYNLSGTGFYTPAEQTISPGKVEFVATTQDVVSQPFDLSTNQVTLNSFILSPTSTDFTLEFAGSDDDFTGDDTGYTTDPSLIVDKRFVRFKVTVTASNLNDPDMITQVVLNYTDNSGGGNANLNVDQFDFQSAGCARVDSRGASPPRGGIVFLLLPLFVSLALGLKRHFN
ncbi:MAG: hypothetical protein KDD33_05420 [Bdellovibrionales bacterium]|nr:hypothetical protein [Bdellovibrionales bacterium]